MSTSCLLPDRLFVPHAYHVHRTEPRTFPAGNAVFFHTETLCSLVNVAQHRCRRECNQVLQQEDMAVLEVLAIFDRFCDTLSPAQRCFDPIINLGIVYFLVALVCTVVAGKFEFGIPPEVHTLLPYYSPQLAAGCSRVASICEDSVYLIASS